MLVQVRPALHERDRSLADAPEHKPAGVAGNARFREARQLVVGNDHPLRQVVRERAEARAEHDAHPGHKPTGARADHVRGRRRHRPTILGERQGCRALLGMELAGLEPATSWVRSRRSPS